jgi:glutathione S-transferase
MSQTLTIAGMPGSPYTRKMLAVLRYRRIPHRTVTQYTVEDEALPKPKVPVIPYVVFPGEDHARFDSTPLISELDARHTERKVRPNDPALAFIDALIEDYADEWLTKPMFHYRWAYKADAEQAAAVLPRWSNTTLSETELQTRGDLFAQRQIDRLWVVGSNKTTGPLIEDSYRRLLDILDKALTGQRFLLGSRPGAGDFALFGQLTQLALFDPTPQKLTMRQAPRIVAWTQWVDDLSGIQIKDDGFLPLSDTQDRLRPLLSEIGRVYVPVMLANARALAEGHEQVICAIDGNEWAQKPFPYQAKCVKALREQFSALTSEAKQQVVDCLKGTGCEPLIQA